MRPDRDCTFEGAPVEAGRHHVAITHGVDLFHAMARSERIKRAHEAVEKPNDLLRRQILRCGREEVEIEKQYERFEALIVIGRGSSSIRSASMSAPASQPNRQTCDG